MVRPVRVGPGDGPATGAERVDAPSPAERRRTFVGAVDLGIAGGLLIRLSVWRLARLRGRGAALCPSVYTRDAGSVGTSVGTSRQAESGPEAGFVREIWSGREDLNLRPPVPQTGALPDCATPRQTTESSSRPAGTRAARRSEVSSLQGLSPALAPVILGGDEGAAPRRPHRRPARRASRASNRLPGLQHGRVRALDGLHRLRLPAWRCGHGLPGRALQLIPAGLVAPFAAYAGRPLPARSRPAGGLRAPGHHHCGATAVALYARAPIGVVVGSRDARLDQPHD